MNEIPKVVKLGNTLAFIFKRTLLKRFRINDYIKVVMILENNKKVSFISRARAFGEFSTYIHIPNDVYSKYNISKGDEIPFRMYEVKI